MSVSASEHWRDLQGTCQLQLERLPLLSDTWLHVGEWQTDRRPHGLPVDSRLGHQERAVYSLRFRNEANST